MYNFINNGNVGSGIIKGGDGMTKMDIACFNLGVAMQNTEAVERYATQDRRNAEAWQILRDMQADAYERDLAERKRKNDLLIAHMACYVERHLGK